ncbi:hypothetical protein MMC26_007736 [Xylographa opegraphella]|nr:hypothetical protein [Xylographa opegraphella]
MNVEGVERVKMKAPTEALAKRAIGPQGTPTSSGPTAVKRSQVCSVVNTTTSRLLGLPIPLMATGEPLHHKIIQGSAPCLMNADPKFSLAIFVQKADNFPQPVLVGSKVLADLLLIKFSTNNGIVLGYISIRERLLIDSGYQEHNSELDNRVAHAKKDAALAWANFEKREDW